MTHSIRLDDDGHTTGVTLDLTSEVPERAWWELADLCIWPSESDDHLPPPGVSRRADAIRARRAEAKRIQTRRAAQEQDDAAVIGTYRRAIRAGANDRTARATAHRADPLDRSKSQVNRVISRALKPR